MEKKRDLTLDYLRAFAIILVVLGHSLQYGLGEPNDGIFDNALMKFIYSFHMPLFMMVSGYLFAFSVKKHSFKSNIVSKLRTLLLPIAIWTIPVTIIDTVKYHPDRFDFLSLFKYFLNEFIGRFWFLWAVLICSVIVLFVNKFLKDSVLVYLLIFGLTFVIPNIIANDEMYRFMYPFFIVSYLIGKNGIILNISIKKTKIVTLVSLIAYIGLLFLYSTDSYIYITGHSLIYKPNWLYQLYIDVYRIVIGLFGSVFFWGLFSIFGKHIQGKASRIFGWLGANTIGIYIISFFISTYLLPEIIKSFNGVNYGLVALETITTIIACVVIILAIKKVKILDALLLGGR